jgi:2-iminobutanoate/2-iminopropanoate deaminase
LRSPIIDVGEGREAMKAAKSKRGAAKSEATRKKTTAKKTPVKSTAKASKSTAKAPKRSRPKRAAAGNDTPLRQGFGSEPGFPISLAMRAGDFVFASAQGDHEFDPADVVYDGNGLVVSDGSNMPPRSVADETRASLRNIEAALREAGCTLADVVDTSVWLRDPRDFPDVNTAYAEFFKRSCPTRSVFRVDFMFDCRVEIKVIAYKPPL